MVSGRPTEISQPYYHQTQPPDDNHGKTCYRTRSQHSQRQSKCMDESAVLVATATSKSILLDAIV